MWLSAMLMEQEHLIHTQIHSFAKVLSSRDFAWITRQWQCLPSEVVKKNSDWEGWKQITISMIIMMNNDAWADDDGENDEKAKGLQMVA